MKIYTLLFMLLPVAALAQKKTDYYPNGKKMFEGSYHLTWSLDDKESTDPEGDSRRRGSDDELHQYANISPRRTYNGLCTFYYPDGTTKRMQGNYANGAKQGVFTYWKENGVKHKEVTYKDGMVDGEHISYSVAGKPLITAHYKAYNQEQLDVLEQQMEKMLNNRYGSSNDRYNMMERGEISYNYSDTTLTDMNEFTSDFKEYMSHFKISSIWHGSFRINRATDASLVAELNFKDNLKDGSWKIYTSKGQLHFEAVFKDDKLVSAKNYIDTKRVAAAYSREGDVNGVDPGIIDQQGTGVVDAPPAPAHPGIFVYVEQMPEAPYDVQAYLTKNMKPPKTKAATYNYRVMVKFVVAEDGSIKDPSVVRPVDLPATFRDEAIRLVKNMPKWKPGKQNGRSVPVYFTMPVSFKKD